MDLTQTRLEREQNTIAAMVRIFCHGNDHHVGKHNLCAECQSLLHYSLQRLEYCTFGDGKPSCRLCPIHCYKPDERRAVRAIMKYSGPRMLLRHPILAFRHIKDEFNSPKHPRKRQT